MGDSTKPSAPTSEPDSTGPESLRARLYSVLPSGELDFVGDLTGCTRGGAAARLKEPASAAGAKPGDLIVVIFQEDRVLRVASLSFVNRLSEAAADDVGDGKSDSDDMSRLIDSEEEGKEGDLVLKMASEDLADGKGVLYSEDNDSEGGKDKSDCEDVKNLLDSEESNWEEDEDAEEETDEDDESDDDDNEDALENDKLTLKYDYWIQVRVWSTYAVIVLYVGGRWRLTRQHTLHWLQPAEIEAMLERVGIEDDGTLALSSWSKVKLTLAFEGTLGCSDSVERLVNSLTPSMDNFQVNEVIGVTSTSKIYRGAYVDTCLGDLEFALKKLQITEEFDDEEAIDHQEPREVTIFSSLKGSNIVGFFQAWACDGIYKTSLKGSDDEVYDVLEDGPDPRYFIIQMELCHRTLHDVLETERVREVKAAWATFKEITKAVKYIHQNGVIHRDLKPGNIFLGSPGMNQIKVGDFGHGCWSKNYADGQEGTPSRGTLFYFAPELNETSEHTDKADMYSIGVILVELFHYFKTGQEKVEVLGGLKDGKYPTEWRGDMVLLKKLTSSSPRARPSAKEVLNFISNHQ